MKVISALMLTIGIIRVLGGFPYTWSSSPPSFSRRQGLVAWTAVIGLLCASSVLLAGLTIESRTETFPNQTVKLCIDILNRNWYLVSTSLVCHITYNHRLLVQLLTTVFQVPGLQLEGRLTRKEKIVAAATLFIFLAYFGALFLLFFSVIDGMPFFTAVMLFLCRCPLDSIAFTVPIFFYLVVRILTSALEDKFLSYDFYISMCEEKGNEDQSKKISDRCEQASERLFLPGHARLCHPAALTKESLRSFTYDIYKQCSALEKLISYVQFPALVLLLNEFVYSTVMTYFMVTEACGVYHFIVPLSFLCCSLCRATVLINTPEQLVKEVMNSSKTRIAL